MAIALVTDSSAALPSSAVRVGKIGVVPLHVAIDGVSHDEGVDISIGDVAQALRDKKEVSTSRPSPGAFLHTYETFLERGFDQIVSVHMSSEMSATLASAEIAAGECAADVRVVDSRSAGMAIGYSLLAAREAIDHGADLDEVVQVVQEHCAAARTFLYVDTLEYLRRGGRVGAASAFFGSALAIKPLLEVTGGHIEPLEKVRTGKRALARMTELAVEAAGEFEWGADLAVQHFEAEERAQQLAESLAECIDHARRIGVVELSAAVGAHVGPGAISVCVAPHPEDD